MANSKLRPPLVSMTPVLVFSFRARFSFSRRASKIICRLRASISKSGIGSSLPERECRTLSRPIDDVDFIFRRPRGLGGSLLAGVPPLKSSSGLMPVLLCGSSLTSLRLRRLRNSRAIFSSVDPRFLGVGGMVCDLVRWGGELGKALLMGGALFLLCVLLLVDGRSPVAKLTPESVLRSMRRMDSASAVKNSGPVTSRDSSMTPLAVRRYLSTISRTTAQPLESPGR